MRTNEEWLLDQACAPIRYAMTRDPTLVPEVEDNPEVRAWLERLEERARCKDLSNIHGSHDYRYENITGKCAALGLDREIGRLDGAMRFFLDFLDRQILKSHNGPLTFGRMYQFRDYETVLACYLPHMGYAQEPCVRHVARKRIHIIHGFVRQKRYDIFLPEASMPGIKREWQSNVIRPELYADGNIALPSTHDLILLAGMYASLETEDQRLTDEIVSWLLDKSYAAISPSFYYYAPLDPSYKAKSIDHKVPILDLSQAKDTAALSGLVFMCFLLSHLPAATRSGWFKEARSHLDQYRTETGRYLFPLAMIQEKKDHYVYHGGHMSAGEPKGRRNRAEIISTYWMERIERNVRSLTARPPTPQTGQSARG